MNENTPDNEPKVIKLRGFQKISGDTNTKAKRFVDDMYSRFPNNPLNHSQIVMMYGTGDDQRLALVELVAVSDDTVEIKWISTHPQRQGVGKQAIADLQGLARTAGVKLVLTAWKHGAVPEKVLNRFYTGMGFKSGRYRSGLQWDPAVDEGEVIPFARPALKPDSQNLHLARELASELFWIQASTYGTEEEDVAERNLEDKLAKIGYKAEWDTDDTEFNMVITHIASGKRYHMGEKELIGEGWSNKYKKSINCSNPKGFSQRAHCAARRKRAHGGKTKSKPVREDTAEELEKKKGKLLGHLHDSFRDKNAYDALEWMLEGGWTVDDSPAIKAMFDANIKQIGGLVMQEIRQGDADAGVIGSIREMVEDIGISMPNDKIADYLQLQTYHIDRVLGTMVEDGMIQNAIMLADELGDWGLPYELADFIDLDGEKDKIIRIMLRDMKANRVNWVRRFVGILKYNGVDWPELSAFEKSLSASNQRSIGEAGSIEKKLARDPDLEPDIDFDGKSPIKKMGKKDPGNPPGKGWTAKKKHTTEIDPTDVSLEKDMGEWGYFVLTKHFTQRMRERKIPAQQVFGIITRVFDKNRKRIESISSPSKFVVIDPTGLGIVVHKSKMSDGRIRYAFLTAHPNWHDKVRMNVREGDLLDKPTPTVEDLAKKYKISPHDVLKELAKGVEIEQEHTNLLHVAREIALDHLGEDLYYYVKLANAEKSTDSQPAVPSQKVREEIVPKKLPKTEVGWLTAVSKRPDLIRFNTSPSEAVQIAALKKDPDAIGDIENPSEDMQLFAVRQDGDALRSIKNPSKTVQMAAVNQNGRSISYVKDPSEEMQIAAVTRYGSAIGHIRNPSKAVKAAAIKSDAFSIAYISSLDHELLEDPEIKKAIMTRMLSLFHTRIDMAKEMLRHLKRANCDWSELAVIEKSINADGRSRNEQLGGNNG